MSNFVLPNLSQFFGLDDMAEDEREVFLAEIGSTILESALLSFTLSLDESDHAAFEKFLAEAGEGEALMEALSEQYPAFITALQQEIQTFQDETQKLMDSAATP